VKCDPRIYRKKYGKTKQRNKKGSILMNETTNKIMCEGVNDLSN
jgi:hypothetical protein